MCATRDRREESRYGAWPRQRPDALWRTWINRKNNNNRCESLWNRQGDTTRMLALPFPRRDSSFDASDVDNKMLRCPSFTFAVKMSRDSERKTETLSSPARPTVVYAERDCVSSVRSCGKWWNVPRWVLGVRDSFLPGMLRVWINQRKESWWFTTSSTWPPFISLSPRPPPDQYVNLINSPSPAKRLVS